jgi:hypothetical protein
MPKWLFMTVWIILLVPLYFAFQGWIARDAIKRHEQKRKQEPEEDEREAQRSKN